MDSPQQVMTGKISGISAGSVFTRRQCLLKLNVRVGTCVLVLNRRRGLVLKML